MVKRGQFNFALTVIFYLMHGLQVLLKVITIKDIQFGTYVNGTGPGFESGSYAMASSNVTTTIGQIALGVGDTIEAPMVGLSISGTKAADEGKGLLIFFNNNSADHGGYYHMNPS